MAASTGLSDYPPELIDEIAGHSTPADLLALAYTGNKNIYNMCIPYQYDNVTIHDPVALVRFCETVAMPSNADLAARVKVLRFHARKANALSDLSKEHVETCATGIAKLRSLHSLRLDHPVSVSIVSSLQHAAFPLLHTFGTPFSLHLDQFLRMNPQIQHLDISSTGVLQQTIHIPSVSIRLPHLRTFKGPEALARAVIPGSRVTEPEVIWDPESPVDRVRETLACLAESAAGISGLRNQTYGWPLDLPALIAEQFGAGVRVLEFRRLLNSANRHSNSGLFPSALVVSMRRFPELTTLLVHNAPYIMSHATRSVWAFPENFEIEWERIQEYHLLCPKLDDITLMSGVQWQRVANGRWIPVDGEALYKSENFKTWFKGEFPDVDFEDLRV